MRDFTSWGDTQLKLHLARLVEMEYVLLHRGGRGQSFVYELLYDGKGQDGQPFVPGLIDIEKLRSTYDANRSGQKGEWSGSGRPVVGVPSGGGRCDESDENVGDQSLNRTSRDSHTENAVLSAKRYA